MTNADQKTLTLECAKMKGKRNWNVSSVLPSGLVRCWGNNNLMPDLTSKTTWPQITMSTAQLASDIKGGKHE